MLHIVALGSRPARLNLLCRLCWCERFEDFLTVAWARKRPQDCTSVPRLVTWPEIMPRPEIQELPHWGKKSKACYWLVTFRRLGSRTLAIELGPPRLSRLAASGTVWNI